MSTNHDLPGEPRKPDLKATGDIDLDTVSHWRTALASAVDRAEGYEVLIDMAEVTFIDSTGLSAFIATRNAADSANKAVVLLRPSPSVARVLTITGLDSIFEIRPQETADGD